MSHSLLKIIRRRIPLWVRTPLARMRGRGGRVRAKHIRPLKEHEQVLSCTVAYNPEGAFCVPLSSALLSVGQRTLEGMVYETKTHEYIAKHYPGGDIIHAGAYFGDYLPFLSRLCTDRAKVWAFEPQHESFRCADITVRLNGLSNVELMNVGLGEVEEVKLLETDDPSGNSLGGKTHIARTNNDHNREGGTKIDIVRLDEVIPEERHIGLVHLDLEGYEMKALEGALRIIKRDRPLLLVESIDTEQWCQKHLYPLGYRSIEQIEKNNVLSAR